MSATHRRVAERTLRKVEASRRFTKCSKVQIFAYLLDLRGREKNSCLRETKWMLFRNSDATMMRTAGELSAAFLSFIVAIAIGWWFGHLLDGRLGTAPWITIV